MKDKTLSDIFYERKTSNKTLTIVERKSEKVFSYSELFEKSLAILSYLQHKEIQQRSEIIFQVDCIEAFVTWYWACLLGGYIPVPLNPAINAQQKDKLIQVFSYLNSPYFLLSRSIKEKLQNSSGSDSLLETIEKRSFNYDELIIKQEDFPAAKIYSASGDDIAFIQFSSGSTGQPKGIVLTHNNLITNILAMANSLQLADHDKTLSWMPLTHDMGLIAMHILPIVTNIDQVIMPTKLFVRNPLIWLKEITSKKVTLACSPNFGYSYTLRKMKKSDTQSFDLSSIRQIVNGAEPISYSLCKEFISQLKPHGLGEKVILPVYGLAEASLAVTFPPINQDVVVHWLDRNYLGPGDQVVYVKEESSTSAAFVDEGYAIDDCAFKITNDRYDEVCDLVVGKILVKGGSVTSGYYNNQKSTNAVITEGNWLDTGDLGFRINNRLVVTGRIKDIVFINGQNFYGHDIERVLEENISEIEAGKILAVGIFNHDQQKNELLVFAVSKAEIQKFALTALHIGRVIREYFGVDTLKVIPVKSIPKTTSGKVQRFQLQQQYINGDHDDSIKSLSDIINAKIQKRSHDLPENKIEEQVLNIWKEVLQTDLIGATTNFHDLGGDSLNAINILNLLHQNGLKISQEDFYSSATVREISKKIETFEVGKVDLNNNRMEQIQIDLLPSQHWYLNNNIDREENYNGAVLLSVGKNVREHILEQSFKTIVQYYDSIRSLFVINNNTRKQVLNNKYENCALFKTIDLTDVEIDSIKNKMDEHIMAFHDTINFEKGPIIIGTLFKTKDGGHFFISMHHLVMDGQTMHVLIADIFLVYQQLLLDMEIKLPPKTTPIEELSQIVANRLSSDQLKIETTYWQGLDEKAEHLPIDQIITEGERVFGNRQGSILKAIDKSAFKELKATAREHSVKISDLVISAWCLAIKETFNVESYYFDYVNNGRDWRDPEINTLRTAGWLSYHHPVLVDMNHNTKIEDIAKYIHKNQHQVPESGRNYQILREMIYSKNQQDFCPRLNSGRGTLLIYQGEIKGKESSNEGVSLSPYHVDSGIGPNVKFPYSFFVELKVIDGALYLILLCNKKEYKRQTYDRLVTNFKALLRKAVLVPELP